MRQFFQSTSIMNEDQQRRASRCDDKRSDQRCRSTFQKTETRFDLDSAGSLVERIRRREIVERRTSYFYFFSRSRCTILPHTYRRSISRARLSLWWIRSTESWLDLLPDLLDSTTELPCVSASQVFLQKQVRSASARASDLWRGLIVVSWRLTFVITPIDWSSLAISNVRDDDLIEIVFNRRRPRMYIAYYVYPRKGIQIFKRLEILVELR